MAMIRTCKAPGIHDYWAHAAYALRRSKADVLRQRSARSSYLCARTLGSRSSDETDASSSAPSISVKSTASSACPPSTPSFDPKQQCWCGDANTNYASYGVSNSCDYDCAGDSSQKCGGYNAMNVYRYP